MNQKLMTTSGLLIAVILFLAINMASGILFKTARLDLTENKLYTLSEGSKNILRNLAEPITLRFYFSQKLASMQPSLNNYAVQVQELLSEYQRLAGDKLNFIVVDPEPFSEEEDRADSYGLQSVPIQGDSLYFGLAGVNSTDDKEVIPFFLPDRAEFLEYDVTQLIYQLSHPAQKILGLMSSLPLQGGGMPMTQTATDSWMIMERLQQAFTVRPLQMDVKTIPEDIDVLMLVHPKNLAEPTLYAIDQFVLKGGRAIVFVDPHSEAEQPPADPQNPFAALQAPRDSNLEKLFTAWGIELMKDKVVADLETAQKVQTKKGSRVTVLSYPVWMSLNEDTFFNREEIITGQLKNMTFATAGVLKPKAETAMTVVPLIETGQKATTIETSQVSFLTDPTEIARNLKSGDEKLMLAARITGLAKTAFPEGQPQEKETSAEEMATTETAEPIKEAIDPINVIVVADTDVLADKFWVQVQRIFTQRIAIPYANNADFVSNAVDNLAGSNDLISLRSRGSADHPFTRVEALQQEAEQRFREKEKELLAQLKETDQKIRALQTQKQQKDALTLSVEQQQEIARFRQEKIKIRKELRDVQHELRKNIAGLEATMKFVNIGLMPLLIGISGFLLSVYRSGRRSKTQHLAVPR